MFGPRKVLTDHRKGDEFKKHDRWVPKKKDGGSDVPQALGPDRQEDEAPIRLPMTKNIGVLKRTGHKSVHNKVARTLYQNLEDFEFEYNF
jgi:hypothetical protein